MSSPLSPSLQVRVAGKTPVALDITLFDLVAADGSPLPAFSAGSHVDVHLPGGLIRQYSLCNAPGETHRYQIAVLKEAQGRGGSRALHEQVQPGDTLTIGAPRNHFALAHGAQAALLLAGGIGITPLLCMAERLSTLGQPFELRYCTRSAERTAFRERIATSPFAAQVRYHHDDGGAEGRLDLDALLRQPRPGLHLYTCGPRGFMDAVLATARRHGWPEDQLHYEFFGADVVQRADDGSFEVQVASSGQVVRVEADQTVTASLATAGVHVMVSCEQGVCGTCLTRVLEGEPDHRDSYLTEEERTACDQFLPCCSRARSPRLVLDL